MIKIQKRRLFKITKNSFPLTIFGHPFLISIIFILTPFFIYFLRAAALGEAVLFCLINLLIVFILGRIALNKNYSLNYKLQVLQEKYNILNDQHIQQSQISSSLKIKTERYNSLQTLVEEINNSLNLDQVADSILRAAFSIIADNKGVCLMHLIDKHEHPLRLFKSRKDDEGLVIKSKQGDIFDYWVLRHSSPLLIEDVRKDFRFDLEKIKILDLREFGSLISAPFISEKRFLGILRLDNESVNFYTQDDLRFLVSISDLGAVALENSQLFQETEELALRDGLTSLFTKQHFLERLAQESKRAIAQRAHFSLLVLDIDHFKLYNDKYGHTVGDMVLKTLSSSLSEHFKKYNPIIGRFGGEEFIVILPGQDKKQAYLKACAFRRKIEKEKIVMRRQESSITVSIGIAGFPEDAVCEDELILKADKAMYNAKAKGRNKVCCF